MLSLPKKVEEVVETVEDLGVEREGEGVEGAGIEEAIPGKLIALSRQFVNFNYYWPSP